MRVFENEIDPFFMTVGLSCGGREKIIRPGKGLVKDRNKIILQRNFEFDVMVILTVIGFEQKSCFRLSGERRKLSPTIESKGSKFKRIFFIRFNLAYS